jgi:hypothetical protein
MHQAAGDAGDFAAAALTITVELPWPPNTHCSCGAGCSTEASVYKARLPPDCVTMKDSMMPAEDVNKAPSETGEKSKLLLLTTTDMDDGAMAGEMQNISAADSTATGRTVRVPKRHVRKVESRRGPPIILTRPPPAASPALGVAAAT